MALKAEQAAELEAELIEKWGVSQDGFSGLLESLAAENERAREVRFRIQRREGRSVELAELVRRLEADQSTFSHACHLLELASTALVKVCVDEQVKTVGQCGYGRNVNDAIPAKVFDQSGVEIKWWDTIESDDLPSYRRVRFRQSDTLRLWPAQQSADSPPEPRFTVPAVGDSGTSPSNDPIELAVSEQRAEPPSSTLPWAVFRIMGRLGYPPDRAWNLLHQAMCANELTPRKGKLWTPGEGPKLEQWERDNLHFDFRRYQYDERSGGPVGSLRIAGRSFHPHEITVPAEEVEHWLASHVSADRADRSAESLAPQSIVAGSTMHGRGALPRTVKSATEAARTADLAWERRQSFSRLACLGRLNERLAQSPEWVNGDKLADWWARQRGGVTGDQRRQLYDEACRSIFRGVLAGEFAGYGQYAHLVKHGTAQRALPAGPNVVAGTWFSGISEIDALRDYVQVLWLPAAAVKAWLATHNMRLPSWLTDSPGEPAPSGFLYIDDAVDVIRQRLGSSDARAAAALLDVLASGEIATRRRNASLYRKYHEHFDRENWRGARLDVEAFRRQNHGGVVILGREYHLHRFLLHATDFDTWLKSRAGDSEAKEMGQTTPGNLDVPRTDQGTAYAPLIDNLQSWFAEWSAQNPGHSEVETMKAAEAKFQGQRITRLMIRNVRGRRTAIRGHAARNQAKARLNMPGACGRNSRMRQFAGRLAK